MANGMESLQTLLRLRTPQHVTQDPYVAQRRSDIFSGVDDMVPDADSAEAYGAQAELAKSGVNVSRDQIRNPAIAKLRQALNMKQMEHEQAMERATVPLHIKGQYDVAAANASASAMADRLALQDQLIRGRQDISANRVDDRQAARLEAQQARGSSATSPTDAMEKRLSESRSAYGGTFNKLKRNYLGMEGGRGDYLNSLTSVLTRMGTLEDLQMDLQDLRQTPGNTLDERIANLGADPSTLHPYEREWLELQLGQ